MGRNIQDMDLIPDGCVIHVRVSDAPSKAPPAPAQPEPSPEQEEDESSSYVDFDEEEAEELLRINWNDPEAVAEYRARLEERGIDPDAAQEQLQKTVKTIRRYQHYVFFFLAIVILVFLAWPPLGRRVKDSGNNTVDNSNLSGFAKFYAACDYIMMVNIWWWICATVALLVVAGTCTGKHWKGAKLLKFYRFIQWVFLGFNLFFIIASGFKIEPFNTMVEKGVWVSMACCVILVSCFRVARIFVSHRYWTIYKKLNKHERVIAHAQMNPCTLCQNAMQPQVQQVQMPGN